MTSQTSSAKPTTSAKETQPNGAAVLEASVDLFTSRLHSAGQLHLAITQHCQEYGKRQTDLFQTAIADLTALAQACATAGNASALHDRQSAYAQRAFEHAVACNRLGVDWVAGMTRVIAEAAPKTKD